MDSTPKIIEELVEDIKNETAEQVNESNILNTTDKTVSEIDPNKTIRRKSGHKLAFLTDVLKKENSEGNVRTNNEEKDSFDICKKTKHDLPALASALTKRSGGVFQKPTNAFAPEAVMTDADLRKHVFIHARGKQLMSGLKIHSFSRKTFISSFSVGLAVGCLVAIVCKLLFEIAINAYTNHYGFGEDVPVGKHGHHRHPRNH